MQHTTDMQPAADARHADHGTGTGAQAITAGNLDSVLTTHARACVLYLDAAHERYLAEAKQRRAAAAAALLHPLLSLRKRHVSAADYEARARIADKAAAGYAARAERMRKFNPELRAEPCIRLTAEVHNDCIHRTAIYEGGARSVGFNEIWSRDENGWLLIVRHGGVANEVRDLGPFGRYEFKSASLEGIAAALQTALDAWPLPAPLADLLPAEGGAHA
ncbi:hypothetical protein J5226_21115 [Lysobacter sp. K5869]|uniref:hypothetical protein n=1 Tax=Lysobacter sp. K5869 TaxID=2820808 RepID=UPI001C062237|nr:hypothetical protein [Lysobacter sp. K5869]QWP76068.1 hypothetical protein J5226_21115 [Lysobacter sp. K5869]